MLSPGSSRTEARKCLRSYTPVARLCASPAPYRRMTGLVVEGGPVDRVAARGGEHERDRDRAATHRVLPRQRKRNGREHDLRLKFHEQLTDVWAQRGIAEYADEIPAIEVGARRQSHQGSQRPNGSASGTYQSIARQAGHPRGCASLDEFRRGLSLRGVIEGEGVCLRRPGLLAPGPRRLRDTSPSHRDPSRTGHPEP